MLEEKIEEEMTKKVEEKVNYFMAGLSIGWGWAKKCIAITILQLAFLSPSLLIIQHSPHLSVFAKAFLVILQLNIGLILFLEFKIAKFEISRNKKESEENEKA